MNKGRRWLRLVAVTGLAWIAVAQPASAETAHSEVSEVNGTISPPLTSTPQPVSGGEGGPLLGAVVINGSVFVVNDTCNFTFGSTGAGDDLATGSGTASGGCTGTVSLNGTETYLRVGAVETDLGTGTMNGVPITWRKVCTWVPHNGPAVSAYWKVCVWVPDP